MMANKPFVGAPKNQDGDFIVSKSRRFVMV
jgi:hypothetical protein